MNDQVSEVLHGTLGKVPVEKYVFYIELLLVLLLSLSRLII